MTISTTTIKNSYSGNGSTSVFNYTFKITDEDHVTVIIRTDSSGTETIKTKTTHYTVSGVGSAGGGSVTFTSGNFPASGETVLLRRDTPQTQGMDLIENDPLPADTLETAHDKVMSVAQELQEEVDRSIKLSRTNTMTSTEFTVDASTRANKILAFDGNGEIAVTQELGTFVGNWSASTSYNARDLVKDTSTNNIFICTTSHTSSGSQPLTTNTDSGKWSLLVDAASATTAQTAAAASATAAASSATASASSASAASTSETNAATSATTATTKASEASTSASNASTSETNAASSATSAASSATTATTQASAASTSATNAATSATAAATSATNAATSETNAGTSETNSATSETNAATSASTATTQATNAATSATSAASSATTATTQASAASTSATNAATSATSAAASAASAANTYDQFDDRYLGSKTSDPSVDNDGNALVSGALYFNTSANEMRVYDGANWIPSSAAGTASLILYEYTATAGQTTFSGSDDNSATLSYSVDNLQVVLNGVVLDPSDYTATNGTSIVLGSAASLNDTLNVYAFKSFTVSELNANNLNDGTVPSARVSGAYTGITEVGTLTGLTTTGNINLGDNDRARFGDSGDLQIYHSGSESYVRDTGTGVLYIDTNGSQIDLISDGSVSNGKMARFVKDGAVELYYDNSKKFETTSTGATVTGNLGIGTTSPGTRNDVVGGATIDSNANTVARFRASETSGSDTGVIIGSLNGNTPFIGTDGGNASSVPLTFRTENTERMRINNAGTFYLNTTSSPLANGDGAGSIGQLCTSGDCWNMKHTISGNTMVNMWQTGTSGANAFNFHKGNTQTSVGGINITTGGTSFNTSSDYRLKENVNYDFDATTRLKQLRPARFNFIVDADKTVDGFLAHEVSSIVPEAITGEKDAVKEDGTPDYQGIDQSKLVPLLVKTIQELEARITELENN